MPLSEHEQRLLDQIERALYAEDPKFVSTVRGGRLRRPTRRRRLQGVAVFALGLVLLVVGVAVRALWIADSFPVLSVIGFLVMLPARDGRDVRAGRRVSRPAANGPSRTRTASPADGGAVPPPLRAGVAARAPRLPPIGSAPIRPRIALSSHLRRRGGSGSRPARRGVVGLGHRVSGRGRRHSASVTDRGAVCRAARPASRRRSRRGRRAPVRSGRRAPRRHLRTSSPRRSRRRRAAPAELRRPARVRRPPAAPRRARCRWPGTAPRGRRTWPAVRTTRRRPPPGRPRSPRTAVRARCRRRTSDGTATSPAIPTAARRPSRTAPPPSGPAHRPPARWAAPPGAPPPSVAGSAVSGAGSGAAVSGCGGSTVASASGPPVTSAT